MGDAEHLVEIVIKGFEKYTLKFNILDAAVAEYKRLQTLRLADDITDVVIEDKVIGLMEWTQPASNTVIRCIVRSDEIESVRLIMRGTPERVKQMERLGAGSRLN